MTAGFNPYPNFYEVCQYYGGDGSRAHEAIFRAAMFGERPTDFPWEWGYVIDNFYSADRGNTFMMKHLSQSIDRLSRALEGKNEKA